MKQISGKAFRQVDESYSQEKIDLFKESEKGWQVGLFAGMTAAGATLASTLTAVFNFFPLAGILAVDAGAVAVGGAATIWLAQKINYRSLEYKYQFKDKYKVKVLLPGQTHVEKVNTFMIDERRNYRQNGYYIQPDSQSFDFRPTHEVQTNIIQKWNGSFVEQTVTPLPEYVWDDVLESTLEVHEITEIPKVDIASATSKASVAINRVQSRGKSMAERIREIEESTVMKSLEGTAK